jgi:hypothetical protein
MPEGQIAQAVQLLDLMLEAANPTIGSGTASFDPISFAARPNARDPQEPENLGNAGLEIGRFRGR